MSSSAENNSGNLDSEDFQIIDEDGHQHHRGRRDAIWTDCAGSSRPRPRPKPYPSPPPPPPPPPPSPPPPSAATGHHGWKWSGT
ncbi:hypothetical protein DL98DRAFT_588712 [Cadophora sp. DSE1049]|nr:hypothetical protein DL98DRAFT_588712 [Cadophora sp. DSE1049]